MKYKSTVAVAAITMALSASSNAATILWGSSTNVSGASDVSTNGTLMFASNIGGGAVTVNGVAFADGTQPLVSGGETGSTNSISGITTRWGSGSFAGYGSSGQTGDYETLLTNGAYVNGDGSTHTHTLTDLTNGQQYEIQFWTSDTRIGTGLTPRVQELSDGAGSTLSMDSSTTGQYVIGTFTATGTTQLVVWQETGTEANGATANAMQLRAVPEPSSTALLGLGGLALILRRRK